MLQPSLACCFSLQPMTAYRPVLDGCNSCASLAGLVLCFIACFVLLVIAPLTSSQCSGRPVHLTCLLLGDRTLRTQDTSDPQNSYQSIRTLITYNLAYHCGHGYECPDDQSVLTHFGTGSESSWCLMHVFWDPSPNCLAR